MGVFWARTRPSLIFTMSLPIMCHNFWWLQMSLCSLCLLSMRILVLRIFPCISHTSLQVSILHPRHHSSWTGILLPFLPDYFFIARRICINDVAQQCHILYWALLKSHHTILHFVLFLELSSLVLQNKSHPLFLVGDCTLFFLQVKCVSCMVRKFS